VTDIEFNFGEAIPKAEEGSYPGMCVGITPFLINENTPDQKTLLRWDFSLDDIEDPDNPQTNLVLDGVTSLATGPKSKMRAWVTALTGAAPSDVLSLSKLRDTCVGRECLVGTINKDGYSKVDTINRPVRKTAKAPAPAFAPKFGDDNEPAAAPVKGHPLIVGADEYRAGVRADDDLDSLPF
jgi:hypothetical protein